jgi:hypothetical protein
LLPYCDCSAGTPGGEQRADHFRDLIVRLDRRYLEGFVERLNRFSSVLERLHAEVALAAEARG